MKTANAKTAKAKAMFLRLYKTEKYTQKEIAAKTGISEKTISHWVKALPHKKYEALRDSLQIKLQALIDAPDTEQVAIYNMTNALGKLEQLIIDKKA